MEKVLFRPVSQDQEKLIANLDTYYKLYKVYLNTSFTDLIVNEDLVQTGVYFKQLTFGEFAVKAQNNLSFQKRWIDKTYNPEQSIVLVKK